MLHGIRLALWLTTSAGCCVLSACGGGSSSTSNDNHAPVANAMTLLVAQGTPQSANFAATDADPDVLTFSIKTPPMHGTAVTRGGALFTYTPDAGYVGADSFVFQASDGKAVSNDATVSLTVIVPDHAPQIDAITGPAVVDARSPYTLTVTASDVDGDVVHIGDAHQISGTTAPAYKKISGNTISLIAPDSLVVESITMRIFVYGEGHNLATTKDYTLEVHPKPATQHVTTIRGSAAAQGLHLVITGDGYTQNQQAQLVADAMKMTDFVIDSPEIKPYSAAWNVHVFAAVSNEEGVDVPSEGISRDTIFDGSVDCGGVARALCVDNFKVVANIFAEFPAYTSIVVLSNTTRYGGTAELGGGVAVTSLNQYGPSVVLHELGHSFAGLGDEYVDSTSPDVPPFVLDDSQFPNVTQVTNTNLVKWRHWFANPNAVPHTTEAGVGLFEGALLYPHGFFRPTYDSFMRTTGAPMGPVNVEAWILSIYRRLGPMSDVQPQGTNVAVVAGTSVSFTATPRFGLPLQQVQWFENGIEILTDRYQAHHVCCATPTGQVTVTVKVTEGSGLVHAPLPASAAAYFEKTWIVQFN